MKPVKCELLSGLDGEMSALLSDPRCGFYSSIPWLRATQDIDGAEHGYLLARRGGNAVGLAPFFLPQSEENDGYRPHLLFPYRPDEPYLLLGPRRGYRTHLPLPVEAPGEVMGSLLAGAAEVARERDRPWVYAPYLTTATAAAAAASGTATPILSPMCDCWLPARGTSMDDYLAFFPSRRRVRIRIARRRAAAAGMAIEHESLADCIEEVVPLRRAAFARHGSSRSEEILRHELDAMAEHAGEHEVMFTVRNHGRLVGYALWYVWGGLLWGRGLGLIDELRTNASSIMFELLFYRPLELCYEMGLRGVHLGPTNYEAKLRRGAELVPMWQASLLRGREVFPADGVERWTDYVLDLTRKACGSHPKEEQLARMRAQALDLGRGVVPKTWQDMEMI